MPGPTEQIGLLRSCEVARFFCGVTSAPFTTVLVYLCEPPPELPLELLEELLDELELDELELETLELEDEELPPPPPPLECDPPPPELDPPPL
jgi:hypothetical protein